MTPEDMPKVLGFLLGLGALGFLTVTIYFLSLLAGDFLLTTFTAENLQRIWVRLLVEVVFIVAAYAVYRIRKMSRAVYGLLEISFGLVANWHALNSLSESLSNARNFSSNALLPRVVTIGAAVYLIARGIINMQKAEKPTTPPLLALPAICALHGEMNKKRRKRDEYIEVKEVAVHLRRSAGTFFQSTLKEQIGSLMELRVTEGGSDCVSGLDHNANLISLIECGGGINLREGYYCLYSSFSSFPAELELVVFFHHIGEQLTGIMQATCVAVIQPVSSKLFCNQELFLASSEPFLFTWDTESSRLEPAFFHWLDTSVANAFRRWAETRLANEIAPLD